MTMLGKTAGGLFWMFRYLERSENTARLVEAGQRIALTRSRSDDEWQSVLMTAAAFGTYLGKYPNVTKDAAIDWLLRDRDNPSSVLSVVETARNNARLVRTALTREVWESVNESWMVLKDAMATRISERDLTALLTLIRQRAAHVRGAMSGTMLRNEIFNFARIGTFLERADNTARLIDVKYYVLLPSALSVGSSIDNVQWESLLRSVSGEGGFRLTYGQQVRPRDIAQYLLLDTRMPRSLAFCVDKLADNLRHLAADYDTRSRTLHLTEQLRSGPLGQSIDAIFDDGLHEFLQGFLRDLAAIGLACEADFRFTQ
jgi:uncharacterized alpha-E superfamily protein